MPGTGFTTPIFMSTSGNGKERDVSQDHSESVDGQQHLNGQISAGAEADQGNVEAAVNGTGNGLQSESEDTALLEHLVSELDLKL
jgi:phosphosulfolactate synthase (CoM biosynthesis protein A)